MPELPEMRALAERVSDAFGGSTLERIDVLSFSSVRTVHPFPEGQPLNSTAQRGKYMIWNFSTAKIAIHLSQAGRIEFEPKAKKTRPKGAIARFVFADGTAMLFREFGTERKAGWWVLDPDDPGPMQKLGPEPFTKDFDKFILETDDNRRVHTLLRDQKTVSGMGRGYTDDALHEAGISPMVSLAKLDAAQRQKLLDAIYAVLNRGLEHERARTEGLPNKLGDHWTVHGRHGEECPKCGTTLERVSYESYEMTYCPPCQTEGRKLADRRTSKFLK